MMGQKVERKTFFWLKMRQISILVAAGVVQYMGHYFGLILARLKPIVEDDIPSF
jgi:hypothetical protein